MKLLEKSKHHREPNEKIEKKRLVSKSNAEGECNHEHDTIQVQGGTKTMVRRPQKMVRGELLGGKGGSIAM